MVKYRDSIQRTGRGRGTVVQDVLRVGGVIVREVQEDVRSVSKSTLSIKKISTEEIFDALGLSIRRSMVRRLRDGGAMSLTKLGKPYKISLPATLKHVRILEKSRVIITEKRGRVRICVYNPQAFKELASVLASQAVF